MVFRIFRPHKKWPVFDPKLVYILQVRLILSWFGEKGWIMADWQATFQKSQLWNHFRAKMEVSKGPFLIQNQGEIIFLKSSWNSWSNYMESGRNFKRTGMDLIWNPILDQKRAPPRPVFDPKPVKWSFFEKCLNSSQILCNLTPKFRNS